MTHSLAQVASWLKVNTNTQLTLCDDHFNCKIMFFSLFTQVKGADESGNSIESVISRVESYLREGKLAEAADTLEEGVRGSQAEQIVIDWVKLARNRAITEQGLAFLQSYATCLSVA